MEKTFHNQNQNEGGEEEKRPANRANRNSESIEKSNLTGEQLDFIRYLKEDFYEEFGNYDDAETLLKGKSNLKPRDLHSNILDFMNGLIQNKITFSSEKEYKTEITNLLDPVNVFTAPKQNEPVESNNFAPFTQSNGLQSELKIARPELENYQTEGRPDIVNRVNQAPRDVSIENRPSNINGSEKKIKIEVNLNDIQCRIEFREIEIDELKSLLMDFIDTFTGIDVILLREGMDKFSLVEKIQLTDELGAWSYDHLQGVMDISFRLKNGGPLPKILKLEKNFFNKNLSSIDFINKLSNQGQRSDKTNLNMTLETFLADVAEANGKDKKLVKTWLDFIEGNHAHRLEEILNWDEKDWEHADIKVNAAKLIRNHLNQFRFKSEASKEPQSLSKAEKYAIIHRIKRFLIWKTKPESDLENIEYLDERALQAGFQEVREKYVGEYLLSQLESFYDSFTIAKSYSKSLMLNRGMLLYGPPGTGKTVLTDILPAKIGLTPISYPLCASEVNRSLVGQTEKLLLELVSRADRIPYLLCCLAVDEIDGLAPKRDEKAGQSKIDGLAVLLSVIGGIKDVKNLMFLASTNRLNQMDEAFKRRMSGQFFVGRPSPVARKKIIKESQATNLSDKSVDQIVDLTTNFTGAALKQYMSYIVSETKKFNKINNLDGKVGLSYNKLADIAAKTSKQFSIRLGNYSLPELFALQKQKECLLDASFLNLLQNDNQAILNFKSNVVEISYRRIRIVKSTIPKKRPQKKTELERLDLFMNESCKSPKDFIASLQLSQEDEDGDAGFTVNEINPLESIRFSESRIYQYLNEAMQDLETKCEKRPKHKFIMLWSDLIEKTKSDSRVWESVCSWFSSNYKRLSSRPNLYHFFVTNETNFTKLCEVIQWKGLSRLEKQEISFTGKILVDLSEGEPEMRFEVAGKGDSDRLYSEPLLVEDSVLNSFQIIPKLVEFASRRGIDFILLMDQDFLLSKNAFDESKIKENITESMQEFNCYEKSLLIVDVDSLVGIVKSVSESSMGTSTSYNVTDNRLYSMIIHYARSLPKILPTGEYWIALISKNRELSKMIKTDLSWPMTPKEIEEFKEAEKKQQETPCLRCRETYTEEKNELNQCSYHDGFLFEASAPSFEWKIIEEEEKAKEMALKKNMTKKSEPQQTNQNKEVQFVYICCLQPLNSQGCKKYKHTNDRTIFKQSKDEAMEIYGNRFKSLKNNFSF